MIPGLILWWRAGGIQKIFGMSRALVSAMAGSASAADFSVLVATENPTYLLGALVTAPPLAWAQFTYEACLPMALDLGASILYGDGSALSSVVWVNLQGAKDRFDELVEARLKEGCAGLRLMLGYKGGLPTAVYYNCLSAVDMHSAIFQLVLIMTSEMPLYHCMCVASVGEQFPDYILSNCMNLVPASRKGLWQSILYQSGQDAASVCQWYGDYIHDESQHIFDQWTEDSEQAASALSSFLQDLVIMEPATGSCSTVETNPNVFTMMPIPSDHFQICGKTSMCKLRCLDAFTYFYYVQNNSNLAQQNVPPVAYAVSTESPLFNPYQATSSSLYFVGERIVSISTRNISSSRACQSCPAGCIVIVQTQWATTSPDTFTLKTYCVPPADHLKATVYASGLDDWTFSAPPDAKTGVLTYCDLALQPDEIYVLLAFSSTSVSVSQSGLFSSSTSTENVQQMYAVWYDSANVYQQPEQAITRRLFDTSQLASMLMTPTIQKYIFEMPKVVNVHVKECTVGNVVELASGVRGQLLFFMALTFTAEGYYGNDQEQVQRAGYIHAIFTWQQQGASSSWQFFVPCACPAGVSPPCEHPRQVTGSRIGLDIALYLGQQGSLLYVDSDLYLHIPSSSENAVIRYVRIDPTGNSTLFLTSDPPGMQYNSGAPGGRYRLTMPIVPSPSKAQTAQDAHMGVWTRADLFALNGLNLRQQVRSPVIENNTAPPIRWVQSVQTTALVVQWFVEMRVLQTSHNGFQVKQFQSQSVSAQATLSAQCTPYACAACADPRVRLACHALQDCMISRSFVFFFFFGDVAGDANTARQVYRDAGQQQGCAVQRGHHGGAAVHANGYLMARHLHGPCGSGDVSSEKQRRQSVGKHCDGLSHGSVLLPGVRLQGRLRCIRRHDHRPGREPPWGGHDGAHRPHGANLCFAARQRGGRADAQSRKSGLQHHCGYHVVSPLGSAQMAFMRHECRSLSSYFVCTAYERMILLAAGLNSNPETLVQVQFGDVTMDSSWGTCSPLSNDFSVILDPSQACSWIPRRLIA